MWVAFCLYRAAVLVAAAIHFWGTENSWMRLVAAPFGIVAAYDAVISIREKHL